MPGFQTVEHFILALEGVPLTCVIIRSYVYYSYIVINAYMQLVSKHSLKPSFAIVLAIGLVNVEWLGLHIKEI